MGNKIRLEVCMDNFQAILLEGLFSGGTEDPDPKEGWGPLTVDLSTVTVQMGGEQKSLIQTLEPLIGCQINISFHHTPPMPPDPTKWGGGCCYWQPYGWCPADHHNQPGMLLNVVGEGVLQMEDGLYTVKGFDGTIKDLPLHNLIGHDARVAAATAMDIAKMRESLDNMVGDLGMEALGQKTDNLKEIMARLQQVVGDQGDR
jgi:hypothetical protein